MTLRCYPIGPGLHCNVTPLFATSGNIACPYEKITIRRRWWGAKFSGVQQHIQQKLGGWGSQRNRQGDWWWVTPSPIPTNLPVNSNPACDGGLHVVFCRSKTGYPGSDLSPLIDLNPNLPYDHHLTSTPKLLYHEISGKVQPDSDLCLYNLSASLEWNWNPRY